MGNVAPVATRAIKNWNATNRAIKHLDKTPKKMQPSTDGHNLNIAVNQFGNELLKKTPEFEKKVLSFDITSQGVKKNIIPDGCDYVPLPTRKLPQRFELGSPIPPPHVEFGFAIPEVIPAGKITMAQAIDLVKSYQQKTKPIQQLAEEYDLDIKLVESICKYFSLFERDEVDVWVPPSESIEKKVLLDSPIKQEDDRITDDGVSRYIRTHELNALPK